MKIFSRHLIIRLLTVFVLFAPVAVSADSLVNPLGDITDPNIFLSNIIRAVLGVVAIIALVVILYGGIEMLISAGNEDRVKRGRDALMWAFIGLLVVFGSYAIIRAVFLILSGSSVI